MKITSSLKENRLYIYIQGELDHHEAHSVMSQIEDILENETPRDCVIDMSKVNFMDSSGIAIILKTYRRMNSMGGRLWVENVPQQPMRVLDASGIERLIKITALA